MRLNCLPLVATAAALLLVLSPGQSRAALIINIQQVGADVVVTGSGTAITTGLTLYSPGTGGSGIAPFSSIAVVGPLDGVPMVLYNGVTGPNNFGPGAGTFPSSGTGQLFGLYRIGLEGLLLQVPGGYVSGSALSASSTFNNATFSSLGITPGTYVYNFGSGATADTLTIQAGGVTSAPEPGSVALVGVGLAGMVAPVAARRRSARRAK